MLSEGDEPSKQAEETRDHLSLNRLTSREGGNLHDDIERLIDIAVQLFSAIEVHIHHLEEVLTSSHGDDKSSTQTVFKEQLIRTAASLNASLCEVAVHLEGHAKPGALALQD